MNGEAWLPLKYEIISGIKAGPVLHSGQGWQIIKSSGQASKVLLVQPSVMDKWVTSGIIDGDNYLKSQFGSDNYSLITSDDRILAPLASCPEPANKYDALGFAAAIKRTRQKDNKSPLSGGIYCEKLALILPLPYPDDILSDDIILGAYLTGGVFVSCYSERRLRTLAPWISHEDLHAICAEAGIQIQKDPSLDSQAKSRSSKLFRLVGRPHLESFFKEHIIDIIEHQEHYKKLGVDFPSAVVLHGPPGCGKTFAVEALIEYLDLPSFTISSGSIGSPYIHETGRKISEMFDQAMKQSPSLVIIDEMEAFLSDREFGGQSHRVEEVAEFLRRIPEAIENHVLIIGMTNRIEIIDPAILRRGRFDHVIKVDMPEEKEVKELLEKLFSERPCAADLHLDDAIKTLIGRPLSDVSFLVREAARITAKKAEDHIDNASLKEALKLVVREKEKNKPSIGF